MPLLRNTHIVPGWRKQEFTILCIIWSKLLDSDPQSWSHRAKTHILKAFNPSNPEPFIRALEALDPETFSPALSNPKSHPKSQVAKPKEIKGTASQKLEAASLGVAVTGSRILYAFWGYGIPYVRKKEPSFFLG